MSIVSTVVEQTPQASGAILVVERHTDHVGGQYMQSWQAAPGTTLAQINAKAAAHAAELAVSLADGEADRIIQS